MLTDGLLSPCMEIVLALAVGALVMRWLESRGTAAQVARKSRASAMDHLYCDQEDVAATLLFWLICRCQAVVNRGKRFRAALRATGASRPEQVCGRLS